MLKISTALFLVATVHYGFAFYRFWVAFGGKSSEPPDVYLSCLNIWHRVVLDMLFVTQESLGSAAAVCLHPVDSILIGLLKSVLADIPSVGRME